jgi:hypothetical protein
MPYIDTLTQEPIRESEILLIGMLTQAGGFSRTRPGAEGSDNSTGIEPESGPFGPGSYCPSAPLWKFPFDQSGGPRAARSVSWAWPGLSMPAEAKLVAYRGTRQPWSGSAGERQELIPRPPPPRLRTLILIDSVEAASSRLCDARPRLMTRSAGQLLCCFRSTYRRRLRYPLALDTSYYPGQIHQTNSTEQNDRENLNSP